MKLNWKRLSIAVIWWAAWFGITLMIVGTEGRFAMAGVFVALLAGDLWLHRRYYSA